MSTVERIGPLKAPSIGHLGRTLLIGIGLALTAAMLPLWMIYSFIWMARI